jgi:hypothetical protein
MTRLSRQILKLGLSVKCLVLKLDRNNISGEFYFMLLDTCAVNPLNLFPGIELTQNTLNKMKQKINNIKYFQTPRVDHIKMFLA